MPRTYVKRPIKIEAIELKETNILEVLSFIEGKNYSELSAEGKKEWDEFVAITKEYKSLYIKTLGGRIKVCFGDYIIKDDVYGFYSCKSNMFEKTYQQIGLI